MKKYNILQKNPNQKYDGTHYAITGSGGFQVNTISEIVLKPLLQFGKFDFTNALQILIKKDIINTKLGEFKNGKFSENSIRLLINECNIEESQIISLGSVETIYIDFKNFIYDYFKMSLAINMFNEQNSTKFDRSELCDLINNCKVTGYIELSDINSVLKILLDNNICGNRKNSTLEDGFIDGDILFIPNGLSILLSVDCGLNKIFHFDMSIRIY
jgi:hypothetical protein